MNFKGGLKKRSIIIVDFIMNSLFSVLVKIEEIFIEERSGFFVEPCLLKNILVSNKDKRRCLDIFQRQLLKEHKRMEANGRGILSNELLIDWNNHIKYCDSCKKIFD